MMADLTPDERAALQAAIDCHDGTAAEECIAIWRAARAFENEACAKVCDGYPRRDPAEDGSGYWAAQECAAAIRERAKGLT